MTSHALGVLAGNRRTLLHALQRAGGSMYTVQPDGCTVYMLSGCHLENYDVAAKSPLRQSMSIYFRNNPAKFRPDSICDPTDDVRF